MRVNLYLEDSDVRRLSALCMESGRALRVRGGVGLAAANHYFYLSGRLEYFIEEQLRKDRHDQTRVIDIDPAR